RVRFGRMAQLNSPAAQLVRRVYRYGRRFPQGPIDSIDKALGSGESLWSHAEDFLEYLDIASRAPDGPRAQRINDIAEKIVEQQNRKLRKKVISAPGIAALGSAGRRLIAAECCAFLADADHESEKWKPYRAWAYRLRQHDTIITFNYDLVLE